MKFVKGISLFLIYPLMMLVMGFFAGIRAVEFFYPGKSGNQVQQDAQASSEWAGYIEENLKKEAGLAAGDGDALQDAEETRDSGTPVREKALWENDEDGGTERTAEEEKAEGEALAAASSSETLSVDTDFVLEETDVVNQSVVETVRKLPHKYVGMNRERFLEAMEHYEMNPPLSELERGFVGLEVLSFARERVVIRMNYQYLQPTQGFYLAVENNEVIVYLEDRRKVYINTGISLEELPDDIQAQIIQMMWIEDEESLYDFLEAYSS